MGDLPMSMKPINYRGLTVAEREAVRRQRMLDAARMLFGTRGLEQTSLREISAVAHLSLKAASQLFPTKEQLFIAIHQQLAREVSQRMNRAFFQAGGEREPTQAFQMALTAYLLYLKEDKSRARILVLDGGGLRLDDPTNLEAYVGQYTEVLRFRMRQQFPKSYKRIDYQIALAGMAGYVVSACRSWVIRDFDLSVEDLSEHCSFAALGLSTWLAGHEQSGAEAEAASTVPVQSS